VIGLKADRVLADVFGAPGSMPGASETTVGKMKFDLQFVSRP
jgi:hypothetical protein